MRLQGENSAPSGFCLEVASTVIAPIAWVMAASRARGSVVQEEQDSWTSWGALMSTTGSHHFGDAKFCCSQLAAVSSVSWYLWFTYFFLFYFTVIWCSSQREQR